MDSLRRYASIIDDFDAFIAASERPLSHTVRVQTSRVSVDRVVDAFEEAAIGCSPLSWRESIIELDIDRPGLTLPAFLGWVHGQEVVSCLPAPLLDVVPGDVIWDACAAPGSKTGHLIDLIEDVGTVVATDDNLGRLSALRYNLERLGATAAIVERADARRFDPSPMGIEAFDASLVDAPCTGEGTVRKKPSALDDWSLGHVESLGNVQRGILRRAIELTKPGGVVLYSTCTYAPEENEAVVDAILDDGGCDIEPIELPFETAPGIDSWEGTAFDHRLTRARRIYPHHADTGGFFIAKLRVAT